MTGAASRSGPRMLVRFTITLLVVVTYVATQVWLAVLLVDWLDSFLGIAVGVLAATALLYVAGFFRRDLEERIVQDLEQMLPAGNPPRTRT